ncbi:S8 family peptidase [Deinococcus sp.]|uniref:S8 family peptidase n=1 Tax=Deinococcus sp. TaxID=47478 RepID=UPI003B59262D
MTRHLHPLMALSQLAALTWLLVACGSQTAAVQPSTTPAQTNQPQASQASAALEIATVKVRPGTTLADLQSRYPGAQVLALHPDEGYAQLLASPQALAAGAVTSLSLSAQALSLVGSEPNLKVRMGEARAYAQGNSAWANGNAAWASGNSAWAGGNNAWAGGNNAWAGGVTNTAYPLSGNTPIWNTLDLGTGQKQDLHMGQGIFVAVLDTGADVGHPAFKGHLLPDWGWDYVRNDALPAEENWASGGLSKAYGHGTAVAGIILQVAPNATIVPYRVLDPNGEGRVSDIILAINDAVGKGIKVINLSLGTDSPSAALNAAISSAIKKGVMVVASSGNSGDSNVTYPARASGEMQKVFGGGLISVGSVNVGGGKSPFSTYGSSLDVLAPGEGVTTMFPGNQRTSATGTSFATPMVSGAVALAMAAGKTNLAALTSSLKSTATSSRDQMLAGKGTLNIGKLMVSK